MFTDYIIAVVLTWKKWPIRSYTPAHPILRMRRTTWNHHGKEVEADLSLLSWRSDTLNLSVGCSAGLTGVSGSITRSRRGWSGSRWKRSWQSCVKSLAMRAWRGMLRGPALLFMRRLIRALVWARGLTLEEGHFKDTTGRPLSLAYAQG